MLTFSSLHGAIKDYLQTQIGVPVELGKYGELPSNVPCVWIYIEPARNSISANNYYPALRRAKVTFFAVESAVADKTQAAISSVNLVEIVEGKIFSQSFKDYINNNAGNIDDEITEVNYTDSEQPLNFDAIYSDFAVSYLEIWIDYAKTF